MEAGRGKGDPPGPVKERSIRAQAQRGPLFGPPGPNEVFKGRSQLNHPRPSRYIRDTGGGWGLGPENIGQAQTHNGWQPLFLPPAPDCARWWASRSLRRVQGTYPRLGLGYINMHTVCVNGRLRDSLATRLHPTIQPQSHGNGVMGFIFFLVPALGIMKSSSNAGAPPVL